MADRTLLFDLLDNSRANMNLVNYSMTNIKESIFHNLYDAQKALSQIRRFDYKMSDCIKIRNGYSISVPIQMIPYKNRNAFKSSNLYKKKLSINSDINKNTDMFSVTLLVFIDGLLYTDFKVEPYEDISTIYFMFRDGYNRTKLMELIDNDCDIAIISVPIHQITTSAAMSKSNIEASLSNGISLVDFDELNGLTEFDNAISFASIDDKAIAFQPLSSNITESPRRIYYDSEEIKELPDVKITLKNLHLQNILTKKIVVDGTRFFSIDIQNMPVPSESMIIFRKSGNKLVFDHSTKIKPYYPNMYEVIKNHSDDIVIFVYYDDDTASLGNYYDDEIAIYHRFFRQSTIDRKYNDKTIPDIIRSYKGVGLEYSIKDFTDKDIDALDYKFDKLRDVIRENGNNYHVYLDSLVPYPAMFYIDVGTIVDLESRVRHDNKTEITDASKHMEFESDCYLFIFRNDSNFDRMIFYIDNKYYFPRYLFSEGSHKYLYIPVSVITPTSIINIEKLGALTRTQTIDPSIFNSEEYVELTYSNDVNITPSDIYVTKKVLDSENNTYREEYIDKTDYELYYYEDGEYRYIDNNAFYNNYPIFIKVINQRIINSNELITVHVTDTMFTMKAKGINEFNINRDINNDPTNFLIYKNGLLVPPNGYTLEFSKYCTGNHRIRINMEILKDDEISILYSANRFKRVYYQESINKKGIINLTNKIDKPIDLRWYELYLNGKRLHSDNIEIVAPYIIILKNVKSTKNFEVYQKNLDIERVGTYKDWISLWYEDFESYEQGYRYEDGLIYSGDIINQIVNYNKNNFLYLNTENVQDDTDFYLIYSHDLPDSIVYANENRYSKSKIHYKLYLPTDKEAGMVHFCNDYDSFKFVSYDAKTNSFIVNVEAVTLDGIYVNNEPFYTITDGNGIDIEISLDNINKSIIFYILDTNGDILSGVKYVDSDIFVGEYLKPAILIEDNQMSVGIDNVEYSVWKSPVRRHSLEDDDFYDLFTTLYGTLINPDITQVTEIIKNDYKTLFDENGNFIINPDRPVDLSKSYLINANLGELSIMSEDILNWISYWSRDISDKIYELIENDILNDVVDNTLPDIIDMEPDFYEGIGVDLEYYFRKYVYGEFINPDKKQITDKMVREFPKLFDENKNLILNPDSGIVIPKNMLINADKSEIVFLEREAEIYEQW